MSKDFDGAIIMSWFDAKYHRIKCILATSMIAVLPVGTTRYGAVLIFYQHNQRRLSSGRVDNARLHIQAAAK